MPNLSEFKQTNTPWNEMLKCQELKRQIEKKYPATSASKTSAINSLDTLIANWTTRYNTELADATLDALPSSITSQVTALQTTYTNYSG